MDYNSKTDEELIYELETAGRAPQPALIEACLARPDTLPPVLLRLFEASLDDDWPDEDPRWYRLPHFGRVLIAFRELAALPVFERLFTRTDNLDVVEWFERDLAHYGPTAVPTLTRIIHQVTSYEFHYGRSLATDTLALIAYQHPDQRDEIIATLRAQLPPLTADGSPDPSFRDINYYWTEVIMSLSDLGDEGSRPQVEALFQHGYILTGLITLDNYRDSFSADAGLSSAFAGVPVDILTDYYDLYKQAQRDQQQALRQETLRSQGFLPPTAAKPTQSRLNDWVNDRLVKAPAGPKIGRNALCPCGSGLKYKKCHGKPGAPPLSS